MAGYSYKISRIVEAPAETVWMVWTEDKHYERFFHAAPGSVELDVRPGGAWKATMVAPDNSEHPLTGNYLTVDPGKRLEIGMDGRDGTQQAMALELNDVGDGRTEIVLIQTCDTEQERDFAKQGSETLLEWCADYLAKL